MFVLFVGSEIVLCYSFVGAKIML